MNERYYRDNEEQMKEHLKELKRWLKLRNIDFYPPDMTRIWIVSVAVPLIIALCWKSDHINPCYSIAALMFFANLVPALFFAAEHRSAQKKFVDVVKEYSAEVLFTEYRNAESLFKDTVRFGKEHMFVSHLVVKIGDVCFFKTEKAASLYDIPVNVNEIVIVYKEGSREKREAVSAFGLFTPSFEREDIVKELNDKLSERKDGLNKKL